MLEPAAPTASDASKRLGAARLAAALRISRRAVEQWVTRSHDRIPRRHRAKVIEMLALEPASEPGQEQANQVPAVFSNLLAASDPAPSSPRDRAALMLAQRRTALAKQQTDRLALQADGVAPIPPVPGYLWRLAGLGVIEFPVILGALAAMLELAPIQALPTAVGMSLTLVLGTHLFGQILHRVASKLPSLLRSLMALVMLVGLLTATGYALITMRLADVAAATAWPTGNLIFGEPELPEAATAPASFALAALIVTLANVVFGSYWSYRRADGARQAAYAKAERVYRRELRRLAALQDRIERRLEPRRRWFGAAAAPVAALLIAGWSASAIACPGPTVLALIDTTTAYDEHDRVVIMPAIEAMAASLQPGEQLLIHTVRDLPASSRLLFRGCLPGGSAGGDRWWQRAWTWLTTNRRALAAERSRFFAEVRDAVSPALAGRGDAARTALVATLWAQANDLQPIRAIWLFSDLLETSMVSAEALLGGDSEVLLNAVEQPPRLAGVTVHVTDIARFHDPERRQLTGHEHGALIDAWTALIQASGGTLRIVGSGP